MPGKHQLGSQGGISKRLPLFTFNTCTLKKANIILDMHTKGFRDEMLRSECHYDLGREKEKIKQV